MNKTAEYWVSRCALAIKGHNKPVAERYIANAMRIAEYDYVQHRASGGLSEGADKRERYREMMKYLKRGQNAVYIPHSRKGS